MNANEILNEYFMFSKQPKQFQKKSKVNVDLTKKDSYDIFSQFNMNKNELIQNTNNPQNMALLKSLKEEIDQLVAALKNPNILEESLMVM